MGNKKTPGSFWTRSFLYSHLFAVVGCDGDNRKDQEG